MSDDLAHLDAAHRAHAGLSADERIEWIRQDRWIHYARADQVLARLTDLLTYPPRDRMPCFVVVRRDRHGEDTHRPQVSARAPVQFR